MISYETYAHVKDEVSYEPVGQIRVKGIAYPITTYRIVEDLESLADDGKALRARLPHLTLNLDPRGMSAEEQVQARELLQAALNRLGDPRSKFGGDDSAVLKAPTNAGAQARGDQVPSALETVRRK